MTSGGDPGPSTYFFLSYAHTAPLDGEERAPTDSWVSKLFRDLSAAVRAATSCDCHEQVGFFDGLLKAGDDWKQCITRELGVAEVFVPLCSPSYFAMSWPGREWSCFASRLTGQSGAQVRQRILPVLWTPLSRDQRTPDGLDPRELAPHRVEYIENGLRALRMLAMYRDSYEAVVSLLAERIVRATDEAPLDPLVHPLDSFPSAFRVEDAAADFTVAVAAPTVRSVPPGRDSRSYGDASTDWRPFGERERLRLAEYAATTAERLDFSTVMLEAHEAARLHPGTPAVVLIDPWIAKPGTNEAQLAALRRLFGSKRRRWTLPLVVLDAADPQSREDRGQLLDRLERVLSDAGALTSEAARRGARGVNSIEEFAAMMPVMVTEAERQFIKHSSDFKRADTSRAGEGGRSQYPDERWKRSDG